MSTATVMQHDNNKATRIWSQRFNGTRQEIAYTLRVALTISGVLTPDEVYAYVMAIVPSTPLAKWSVGVTFDSTIAATGEQGAAYMTCNYKLLE